MSRLNYTNNRKPPKSGGNRDGLTLIELVAALGLSAMLMAICLTVVGRMSTSGKALLQEKQIRPWQILLRQQLQRDYVGCRSVSVSANSIRMSGYSCCEGTGFTPSEIEYRIVTEKQSNLLYRTENRLLNGTGNGSKKELVCDSIARFRSVTDLDTDVAPGVLILEMELVKSVSTKPKSESSADEINQQQISNPDANPSGTVTAALVRHGGGF